MSQSPLLERPVRKSVVIVSVLDMSSLMADALKRLQETKPNAVAVKPISTWGIVATPRGIYALCDEGVGPNKPVTEENPLEVALYGEYQNENGSKSIDLVPVFNAKLRDKELVEFPVVDRVNLSDFIRSFGRRLEENFSIWNSVLSKASR